MDHISRESNSAVDLEYGEITSGDDESNELGCNGPHTKKIFNRASSLNVFIKGDDELTTTKNVLDSSENLIVEVEEEEVVAFIKKKMMEGKWKKPNSRKAPKPPRPPGAPSLDEADKELVREISELTRLKHARIDRIKSLKKKRRDKASSSVINIFALVITILFCCLIIFQGILASHE